MKKKTILCAVNTLTSINMGPYADHMRMWYRLGKDFPNFDFKQIVARRMSIDRFRNFVARTALELEADYIFFIDDDMLMNYDCFHLLYAAKLDIAMAHVYIRGYPFEIMAFKYEKRDSGKHLINLTQEDILPEKQRKDGVVLCDAIGTAVSLIKVDLLKKIPAPWFVTGPHSTEDIYFCCKARDYHKGTKIGIHTRAITGHQLDPEVISFHTREAHLSYVESFLPEEQRTRGKKKIVEQDRGKEYIKANVEDS